MYFFRRPYRLMFIFGFYFHNVYLASQRIIFKENRISEKHVISKYGCIECQSAFSFYLVSNGSKESIFKPGLPMSRHSSKNYTNQFAVEINCYIYTTLR